MCTAVTYQTRDFYFGRTLDHPFSYCEEVTVTPRNFPLKFRNMGILSPHYAIIGMAHVAEGYPLYYDGMNEKGLAMAGLNFSGYARYQTETPGRENIAQFEFLTWILSQCATVDEAVERMGKMNLTGTPFSEELPTAQLHWLLADRNQTVTLEPAEEGIRVYTNPVGVLTNNPAFPEQLFRLNDFMGLSPEPPQNRFSRQLELQRYSLGMGAMGLPGDLSSQSRFVRAAFVKLNSRCGMSETESVSQFFHILGSVEQQRGCCRTEDGGYETTIYTSCCNTDRGIYYYNTYGNHQITAVHLYRENLDGCALVRYPTVQGERMYLQN